MCRNIDKVHHHPITVRLRTSHDDWEILSTKPALPRLFWAARTGTVRQRCGVRALTTTPDIPLTINSTSIPRAPICRMLNTKHAMRVIVVITRSFVAKETESTVADVFNPARLVFSVHDDPMIRLDVYAAQEKHR